MKCLYCEKDKPEKDFNLKRSKRKCRACYSAYYKHWYRKNGGRFRSVDSVEANREWILNHPEKYEAGWKLRIQIRNGTIKRPDTCSKCGITTRVVAHHFDYNKPYDVIWLCSSCHKILHNQN